MRNQTLRAGDWASGQTRIVIALVGKSPDQKTKRASDRDVRDPMAPGTQSGGGDHGCKRVCADWNGDMVAILVGEDSCKSKGTGGVAGRE